MSESSMSDDKKKAEHHFNWQAIVERIKPELVALVKRRIKPKMRMPRMTQTTAQWNLVA